MLVCPGARAPAPASPPRRAAATAARLAATARAVVTAGPVGAVFTVGGDTTAALVAAMGWAPLAVDGALGPGVAVVRLRASRAGRAAGPRWLDHQVGRLRRPAHAPPPGAAAHFRPPGRETFDASMTTPPLAITMGDASGVGPEILLRAFASGELGTDVVAVGDLAVLDLCNRRLHCDVTLEPIAAPRPGDAGHARRARRRRACRRRRSASARSIAASGAAALAYVARATRLALAGEAAAVVTLPINKAATRLSAPTFTGHTEYVAELCGRTSSTLMLASERAIVTHVSTHVALREAIELAQPARILEVIVQTDEILAAAAADAAHRRRRPQPARRRGRRLRRRGRRRASRRPSPRRAIRGIEVSGPHPPDTVFLDLVQGRIDAVVCMYHDQGHIPMKLLDFRGGVNVTLGLPIVRTSVDHGTAFDIAWKGVAFTDSLRDACAMARRLARA